MKELKYSKIRGITDYTEETVQADHYRQYDHTYSIEEGRVYNFFDDTKKVFEHLKKNGVRANIKNHAYKNPQVNGVWTNAIEGKISKRYKGYDRPRLINFLGDPKEILKLINQVPGVYGYQPIGSDYLILSNQENEDHYNKLVEKDIEGYRNFEEQIEEVLEDEELEMTLEKNNYGYIVIMECKKPGAVWKDYYKIGILFDSNLDFTELVDDVGSIKNFFSEEQFNRIKAKVLAKAQPVITKHKLQTMFKS